MDLLQWIGLGIAALAGGFTALARIYRFGPFLDKIEPMPSTDRIPEDTDFVPASPPPVMAPSEPELPLVAPLAPKTANSTPKATIANFCLGLKEYEGWILPGGKDWSGKVYPKGSNSFQCNNPGNCRFYTGGYLPKYLPVLKSQNNFAVFKDKDTGWLYLNNMVKAKIHLHPDQTILQFMELYAPIEDNNDPVKYSNFLAKRMGVDNSFRMGNLA